jgi:hypothetical protein
VRFLAVRWQDDLEIEANACHKDELNMGNLKAKRKRLTSLNSLNSHILVGAGALLLTCGLWGQSRAYSGSYAPLPDPGYGLYYQDSAGAPNLASRWGYNDGWEDGRRDRNHGDTAQVQEKDRYTIPPDHGVHPGMTRDQYIRIYRQAYTHGYEHGSRI